MQLRVNEEGLREMLNAVGPEGYYALTYMSEKAILYYDDEGNLISTGNDLSLEEIKAIYSNDEAREMFIEAIIESIKTSSIDVKQGD